MNAADFQAIAPLLVLSGVATLLMLQIAFLRNVTVTAVLSAAGLGLAALACIPAAGQGATQVTPLLMMDSLGLLFSALFSLCLLYTSPSPRDA